MKANTKITRRKVLSLIGAGGAVLFGRAAPAAPAVVSRGKPIVLGVGAEADGLTRLLYTVELPSEFIDRYPVNYDLKGGTTKIELGTAEKMPEALDGGLRYRVKFRDDVYYHDGTKLDAEAVAYLANAHVDKNHPQFSLPGKRAWKQISRMATLREAKVVDKLTVDFYLTKVTAAMFDWFAQASYTGVPVKALQTPGFDFANNEVGCGPYKKVEWQRNVRLVLERWEKHYDKQEGIAPQIIIRPIPELGARVAALEAGEVDWVEGVPVEEAVRLKKNSNITVMDAKTLWVSFIHMDTRKKPFNDVRVRQALNYAIDKDTLIRDILGGAGERSYAPLSKQFGNLYAGDKVTKYDYNPQKAKDLLKEAGYANGFESKISFPTQRTGQQKPAEMCQFIQANLAAVGVKVALEEMEWATFEAKRIAGEFAMAARGWTPSSADPDGVLLQNFHSTMVPPTQRAVAYLKDADVDKWIDTAIGTIDQAKRANAFIEAQKRIVDLAPWIFIDHEIRYEATRSNLKGYVPHALIPAGRGAVYAYKE
jgi:peptide/nickel transport system substrate-binding protein